MNPHSNLFIRYLVLIVCLVLSSVLLVAIYFRMEALPDLKNQYEQANRELDIMVRNQSQGAELSAQLSELEHLTRGLQNRLMQPDDKASNSEFFYGIEARSRSKVSNLGQLDSSQSNGDIRQKLDQFTATGFNLSVSGRVGYVMSFLKRLENSRYFVRCNSISIKGDAVIAPDAVSATLKVEILSKKQ